MAKNDNTLSWVWKMMQSWIIKQRTLEGESQDNPHLILEIKTLETLAREIFLELHEIQTLEKRAAKARTLRGRCYNFMGYFVGIFCLYKVTMGSVNSLFDQREGETKDPVTLAFDRLSYVLPGMSLYVNLPLMSHSLSLALVGVLVFSQTRGFLITILKVSQDDVVQI